MVWPKVAICLFGTAGTIALVWLLLGFWRPLLFGAAQALPTKTWMVVLRLAVPSLAFLAILSSIHPQSRPDEEQWLWAWAGVATLFSVGTWELLNLVSDSHTKENVKHLQEQIKDGEDEILIWADIRAIFRQAVDELHESVDKVNHKNYQKINITHVRAIHQARGRLENLLRGVVSFFRERSPQEKQATANFRIGLWVTQGKQLVPIFAFGTKDHSSEPFVSHIDNPAFHLDCHGTSTTIVVQCVNRGQCLIVEDCEQAAKDGKFAYTSPTQSVHLGSMVAYFLGRIRGKGGTLIPVALTIDTTEAGFFKEADRPALEE